MGTPSVVWGFRSILPLSYSIGASEDGRIELLKMQLGSTLSMREKGSIMPLCNGRKERWRCLSFAAHFHFMTLIWNRNFAAPFTPCYTAWNTSTALPFVSWQQVWVSLYVFFTQQGAETGNQTGSSIFSLKIWRWHCCRYSWQCLWTQKLSCTV